MHIGETGPHDDHHADETYHHGGPAAGPDLFAEDGDGEGDDEKRRGEADGHRVGQWDMGDGGEKTQRRGQQQHPPQECQTEASHPQ